MKTHRCAESLKQRIPIRYNEETGWWLYRRWFNWESIYESQGIEVVCKVKYCPFCNEELK